jgi:hypothetical protein
MRAMDWWARPTLQPQLIACHYVRYAIIRCRVYTTDPAEAERIAAWALARACLASRRLGGMADAGLLVELLLEAEASDKRKVTRDKGVISDRRQVTRGRGDLGLQISDCGLGRGLPEPEACGPFDFAQSRTLRSEACFHVAEVLNGMRRFPRDLLILHYIEGLSRSQLGEVHRVAVGRVRIALAEARRDLMKRLADHEGAVCGAHPARFGDQDVGVALRQLAGCLNEESVRVVGECVRQFLADTAW